jgi:hypothetical protein
MLKCSTRTETLRPSGLVVPVFCVDERSYEYGICGELATKFEPKDVAESKI